MKVPSPLPSRVSLVAMLAAWCGAIVTTSAQSTLEITWGSSIMTQKMILSDGLSLESESGGPIIMELGSFGTFIPSAENMDEWMANWKVFDAITDPDFDSSDAFLTNPGDPTQARYSGSAELTDGQLSTSDDASLQNPDAEFSTGEQAYVFFRTSDEYSGESQWLLFTSAEDSDGTGLTDSVWQFPAAGEGGLQFPVSWWVDQADTAIVGAIHGGDDGGGDTGAGFASDTSTDFTLRLHYLPVVPEPGILILVMLSAAAALRHRQPALC